MSEVPGDDALHGGAARGQRAALEAAVVESVSAAPGVARLVPSFRQVLTAAAQRLLNAETTPATGVDIVQEAAGVVVYVDLYIDGSRPAGLVVDDVHAAVQTLMISHAGAPVQVKIRVMGVTDAH
ncbi:hypothetical protein I2485_10320 [Nesterenkonia sp. E16_7]|uniref:hypothetical protein n=1 Tax=unclassified Nesterenkonia TaxID=2629769 RepID=UPI001A92F650|nr:MULTISPECIES: hypothetical protein [unclassified Nesterenkonia]MBO0595515.1 hypothetical protein [Nesterenkonia sp. E16_10]MBO0599039.1 hypothetical protein [Nesterenkonia sp. E16_7]